MRSVVIAADGAKIVVMSVFRHAFSEVSRTCIGKSEMDSEEDARVDYLVHYVGKSMELARVLACRYGVGCRYRETDVVRTKEMLKGVHR